MCYVDFWIFVDHYFFCDHIVTIFTPFEWFCKVLITLVTHTEFGVKKIKVGRIKEATPTNSNKYLRSVQQINKY